MTIDGLASAAATGDVIATQMLRQGLDQTATTVAQLLQGMPAPQPAHLGNGVDTYA